MPKLKTKRSAAKRFKITGSGKVRRRRSFAGHLMISKSPARKRRLRTSASVHKNDLKSVRKLLPYR